MDQRPHAFAAVTRGSGNERRELIGSGPGNEKGTPGAAEFYDAVRVKTDGAVAGKGVADEQLVPSVEFGNLHGAFHILHQNILSCHTNSKKSDKNEDENGKLTHMHYLLTSIYTNTKRFDILPLSVFPESGIIGSEKGEFHEI
jgi:hypothetical protein